MGEVDQDAQVASLIAQYRTLLAKYHKLEQSHTELEATVRQYGARVEQASSVAGILRDAGVPPRPRPAPPQRPPRDRHGLYVVKGAAFGAVLGGLWRLLWSSHSRRLATVASGLAIGGATVLTPAIHAGVNPPQPHTQFRPQRPSATAPGGPPPRHRAARATTGTRQHTSHSAPSPVPSPSPAASSGPPVPIPSPSPPVPFPTPTVPVAGCVHHPHPGCPTPPVDLPTPLPSLPTGRVVSAADWLHAKTHRLKLLGAAA